MINFEFFHRKKVFNNSQLAPSKLKRALGSFDLTTLGKTFKN